MWLFEGKALWFLKETSYKELISLVVHYLFVESVFGQLVCTPVLVDAEGIGLLVFGARGVYTIFIFFFVFLDVSTILKDKPICHLFHWITHSSFGFLCHHCDRIMHGQTMGDVIFRCPEPRMTLCISLGRRIPVMGPGTIIPCVWR